MTHIDITDIHKLGEVQNYIGYKIYYNEVELQHKFVGWMELTNFENRTPQPGPMLRCPVWFG